MRMEVEQKFRVDSLAKIERRLKKLNATVGEPQEEVDLYFAHPSRDFAQTDEALRIRRKGRQSFVTYKGPKIDSTTKTRREIDLPIDSPDDWQALLEALGFRPVAEVRKRRRKAVLDWSAREIEISLDDVDRLGPFVELEIVTDAGQVDPAREAIRLLAAALGLVENERRSYLGMLLAGLRPST